MIPSPTNATKTYNTTDYSMVVSPTGSSQACQCPERNITDKLTLSGACFGWGRLPHILLMMMHSKAHLDILLLDRVLPFWDEQCNAWLCFFTPSEAWKKKYLYCSQVWQCSTIKTILIESSLPRITEDPWTSPHMLLTLLVFTTSLVAFPEIWATPAAQKPQNSSSSVLPWCHGVNLPVLKQKAAKLMERSDGIATRNCHQVPPLPRSARTGWWDPCPTRSRSWRLCQNVILKHIWWCRRVCQTAEL